MRTLAIVGHLLLFGGLAVAVGATPAAAGGDPLTLRLNDAEGAPGELVAVVMRTYQSLPVGQGQACFSGNAPFLMGGLPEVPFADYIGSAVFSGEEDAVHAIARGTGQGQAFVMEFTSPTASINDSDGPMTIAYLRLRDDLVPGQVFNLAIDRADTQLIDANGQNVPIEVRGGELLIRAPGAPMLVEADADDVLPGGFALVTLQTAEVKGLSQGTATLIYDADIADGDPIVSVAPRFGEATYSVDVSQPGRVTVDFTSTLADLNRLPGDLIEFRIPTRSNIPLGTESFVRFDPQTTELFDKDGLAVPLRFEGDFIEFDD